MTPSERLLRHVQLQDALLSRQAEASLRSYVEQAWPILEPGTPFLPNWHIDLLVEVLEAVTAGELTRVVINLPPRYGKSLLVSVLWPTWEWIHYPERRWVMASYSEALSTKHSLDRRALLQSPWFRDRWGRRVQLAADQNVKDEFQNTRRGVMLATSVGGSVTGKGGDRIVVDDLHNPLQAESDIQRETAIRYFRQSLMTRLDNKDKGAVVVVMQRLHEADVSAVCIDLGFTHFSLPAEAEVRTEITFPRSGRVHVRDAGDLLWPQRDGSPALGEQRRILGSVAFAAQYQQSPTPAGGHIFQRHWWRYYDEVPELDRVIQSWDMSFKDTGTSDYVVGLVAGQRGADIYLLDRVKGQWSFSESCRQVRRFVSMYPDTEMILIEDAANGTAIVDALRHELPGVIAVKPDGGKVARAQAAQPVVEAGNVYLPNPRPQSKLLSEHAWVDDFVYQTSVFPVGAHDDDVDAFTQLVARARQPFLISVTW